MSRLRLHTLSCHVVGRARYSNVGSLWAKVLHEKMVPPEIEPSKKAGLPDGPVELGSQSLDTCLLSANISFELLGRRDLHRLCFLRNLGHGDAESGKLTYDSVQRCHSSLEILPHTLNLG